MLRALYTGASGMSAQEMNLENVANNLANSSTAGFRKRRLQFEDLIYQNVVMPGAASTQQTTIAAGLQIGLGARSAASEIVQSQGDFSQTGNSLDLAIQGQGFFQVTLPSGETNGRPNSSSGSCLTPFLIQATAAVILRVTKWRLRRGLSWLKSTPAQANTP